MIAAFNKDKPFDQFLHEQLAGDLLPPTDDEKITYERWTATGFLAWVQRCSPKTIRSRWKMDIVDEQLDTTSRAFMGLTVGCARCHDHKFDPISQAEYYGMAGIFTSSKTMENSRWSQSGTNTYLHPRSDRDLSPPMKPRWRPSAKRLAKS